MKSAKFAALLIALSLLISIPGCREKEAVTSSVMPSESSEDTVNPLTDNMCGGYLDGYETFKVTSTSLSDGVWDDIISNTDIGENRSPQLSWEPVEGAKVYAIYMFDTNTNGYLHWRSGGITETSLPEGWASPLDYNGPHIGHGYTHNFDIYVIALKAPVERVRGTVNGQNKKLGEFIKELDTDAEGNTGNIISYGKISGLYTDSRFRDGKTPESTPVM
ncbi:phosphatidylethanolamine-binding protein (PEBP) family uncharacterized protein [Ruminococcaceae bacterium R-25]|nr:phosphatidylethanolamine-binding protein (PEBP) family uncharacterized protein [Ruminococcaceae bacterium R-25]SUQ11852.1 Uncharacterized conserved protein, phosphatidylethanolamine-binding protein (PEBP) family [Oscillospiraceae bacterium]